MSLGGVCIAWRRKCISSWRRKHAPLAFLELPRVCQLRRLFNFSSLGCQNHYKLIKLFQGDPSHNLLKPKGNHFFYACSSFIRYNKLQMRSLIIFALVQLALMLDYNSSLSQSFQRYTIITHCSNDQLMNWSCKACQSLERLEGMTINENKLASIMTYTGYSRSLDKFMLVFRGTVDAVNWVEDFTFKQVDYSRCKNCKVHEGFYLSYLAVSDEVNKALETLKKTYGDKRLQVLGASLGAAIAMIGGLQLELKYQNVDEIHTFGCPRVGNEDFSMYLKSRVPSIIRVIHNRDIVPHVPLQTQNFHHPPFQVQYNEQMSSFKICSQNGEDPSCSNSFYPYFTATDHVSYWTKLNVHDICS